MDFWKEIKKLEGHTLCTLDKNRCFDVLDVTAKIVIIKLHSTGNERRVPRKEIEGAWNELNSLGHISRCQIEACYSARNPAYVAAILAKMDGVTPTLKPIELKIHRPS